MASVFLPVFRMLTRSCGAAWIGKPSKTCKNVVWKGPLVVCIPTSCLKQDCGYARLGQTWSYVMKSCKPLKIRGSSCSMNNLFQCCTTLLMNMSFTNVHLKLPRLQHESITACFISSFCKEECGMSAFNCHLYSCRLILDHLFTRWTKSGSSHMVPHHLGCSLLDPLQFLHSPFKLRGPYLHTDGDSSVIPSKGNITSLSLLAMILMWHST